MSIRESSYGYWSSTTAFVVVAAAAAIGVGSITRLPYLAVHHGGGAFVICYLLALLVMAWPLMVSELLIGRWARNDVVSGFARARVAAGATRVWEASGWMMLLGAALVLSYISVLAGWTLAYALRAASGLLNGAGQAQLEQQFLYMAQDPERSLAWHTLFMVMACIAVGHGVRDGLERGARFMLLIALAGVGGLLWFVLGYGDLAAAMRSLLVPDCSQLGWEGVFEAIHMAFFTASVGFGVMYALAAYLPSNVSVSGVAFRVLLITVVFSLAGSMAVLAVLLQGDEAPLPGLALIYQSFPQALPLGWTGAWPALLFYLVLYAVALASAIALLEPITVFVMERLRTTRVFAATTSAILVWSIGLLTMLSFSVFAPYTFGGQSIYEWIQWLTIKVLAPGAALMVCTLVVRVMPRGLVDSAWGNTADWRLRLWRSSITYPARILLILLILYGFGAIHGLVKLWA